MDKEYKDKILKLLALAESPNEHEAKAALLKARRLMAEHKLTEADLKDIEKRQVKDITTDITCSKRRNPWIFDLSAVIGKNYCCQGYINSVYRKQTQSIGFVGLEEDVEICVTIFKYAVDCILTEIEHIKKDNACFRCSYVRKVCDSYGYGFVRGISEAFTKQQKENENEWGLVLVIPKEVEEATHCFGESEFRSRTQDDIAYDKYIRGYTKGKEFDPTKRISERA